MTFLNRGKSSKKTYYDCAISQINKGNREWKDKQKNPRDFIHHAMDSHKLLLNDIPRDDVDHLDRCNDANPNIKPSGNIQNRNQLGLFICNFTLFSDTTNNKGKMCFVENASFSMEEPRREIEQQNKLTQIITDNDLGKNHLFRYLKSRIINTPRQELRLSEPPSSQSAFGLRI